MAILKKILKRAILRCHDRQSGFALLIVMWSLGLLALLGTEMIQQGRSAAQSASATRDYAEAIEAANGGVREAIFQLLRSMDDPVAISIPSLIGRTRLRITIESQAGKINPNFASVSLLRGFLAALGVDGGSSAETAQLMVDWRTPAPVSGAGGLKTDRYRAAGLTYGPPGRFFHSIDELGLIPGITPSLLTQLRPWLCLYLDNAVAPPAATGPVAQAVAATPSDEIAFVSVDRVFTIHAAAAGPGRARLTRAATVRLRPGGGPPQILTWDAE